MSGKNHISPRIVSITLAALLLLITVVVSGILPSREELKITPAAVSVETNPPAGAPDESGTEAAWRLFDRDTTTSYAPSEAVRVIVDLQAVSDISRIRFYGASACLLNVYIDVSGTWEAEPSLTGVSLDKLGQSWNTLEAADHFSAQRLLFELMPLKGTMMGELKELEIWGLDSGEVGDGTASSTLEGLDALETAQSLLAMETPHIMEYPASTSELSVPENVDAQDPPHVELFLEQDPSVFKRAYLKYEGYNVLRPVSVERRINGLSWSDGFFIYPPYGETLDWKTHLEEINPQWLVRGENRLDFRAINGTAHIRNLSLIVETDNGWTSVSSVSDSSAYDGDMNTHFLVPTLDKTSSLEINFERTVEPEKINVYLPGPINMNARLQYLNGDAWDDVKAAWSINFTKMHKGWNEIPVEAPVATKALRLVFDTSSLRGASEKEAARILELQVCASPAGTTSGKPRLVVSYPRDGEYFGRTAYVKGFVVPGGDTLEEAEINVEKASGASIEDGSDATVKAARVNIEDKPVNSPVLDGSFSLSISKDETRFHEQADNETWTPVVTAEYQSLEKAQKTLVLNRNAYANGWAMEGEILVDITPGREKHSELVTRRGKKIKFKNMLLDIPEGAVDRDTVITIIPLTADELPELDPGMINVTFPDAGYRFLPHGIKFKKAIKISFGYSKNFMLTGQKDDDVNMYFYHEKARKWQGLKRMKVDPAEFMVTSETDHFTDMINATLVVPEHPEALTYNPNTIKDIKAADPSAGINLIEPPAANNMGNANLSYPVEVPRGRGLYTPDLKITYSSNNANGWMGLGWDISVSKIQVDTRWGVPRYDEGVETESYLLDGAALSPSIPRPFISNISRSNGDKVFRKRAEGDFLRIIRKGTSPRGNPADSTKTPYYWEVTDKSGIKYIYGETSQASLSSYTTINQPGENIFQWNLEKVIDPNGNVTEYFYDTDYHDNGEPYTQLYLSRIGYTGYESPNSTGASESGKYVIEFKRESTERQDVLIDGRAGFQVVTRYRLQHVDVKYNGDLVRRYVFDYIPDIEAANYHFGKSLINGIAVTDTTGEEEFYGHTFEYERMPVGNTSGSYAGFESSVKQWSNASGSKAFSQTEDLTESVSAMLHGAPTPNYPTFGFQGDYATGQSETKTVFLDVNGDGLPDQVDESGMVWLNNLNSGRGSGFFTGALFLNAEELGKDRQDNFAIGGQIGAWKASANYSKSYNFVNAEKIVSDLDGDGRVDIVDASGALRYKKNNGIGFENYTAWNGFDLSNVDFGLGETTQELKGNFFLTDPVRKWTAPYKGDVRITGAVYKRHAGGIDDPVDGESENSVKASVRLFIYKNNGPEPIWEENISAQDVSEHSHDISSTVSPGDRLYFRMTSIDDTESDSVVWQPRVSYEKVCTTREGSEQCETVNEEHAFLKDPQGHPLMEFDSGQEMRLSGYPYNSWAAAAKGTVLIAGSITKKKTSDNVDFKVVLISDETETVLFSQSMLSSEEDEKGIPLEIRQEVLPEDVIRFDVLADTTLDANRVAWQPEISYEEYCFKQEPDKEDYTCGAVDCAGGKCTIDVNTLPSGFSVNEEDVHAYVQVNYPLLYLLPSDLPRFWVAPYDGQVTVKGEVVRSGETGEFMAIARGVNRQLWKETVPAGGPDSEEDGETEERFPHDVTIEISKGDQIFFDIISEYPLDTDLVQWEPDILYSEYCKENESGQKECRPVTCGALGVMSNSYGCWYYEEQLYHTTGYSINEETGERRYSYCESKKLPNTLAGCQPITCTDDLIEGTKDCSPLNFIYEGSVDFRYHDPRFYESDREDAEPFAGGYRNWYYGTWNGNVDWDESLIKRTRKSDVPEQEEFEESEGELYKEQPSYYFVYLVPRWQGKGSHPDPLWAGRGEEYISARFMRSSRIGANVTTVMGGASVSTIRQSVSESDAYGVSLSAAIGAGGSYTEGDSTGTLDFLDFNGDRFPDQVSGSGVLVNNGAGGFYPDRFPVGVGDIRNISNENYNAQLSYTMPQNMQNAKGITKFLLSLGPSYGHAYGYSLNTRDLIDVNGDGLPDRVSYQGGVKVYLNMGYRFSENPISWGNSGWTSISDLSDSSIPISFGANDVRVNENSTNSLALSWAGIGGGASYSVARGLADMTDINGDGLPDRVIKQGNENFFRVKLNRGDRFGPEERWQAPSWGGIEDPFGVVLYGKGNDTITYRATVSYNFGGGVPLLIPIIPILTVAWIDIVPKAAVAQSLGGAELAFQDINGDGLPDHILKKQSGSTVSARLNNVGQANLLKRVARPLGGSFSLGYERVGNTVDMPQSLWALTSVTVNDGMAGIDANPDSVHEYITEYEYGDGYHDRDEREFLGFDMVVERKTGRKTVRKFHNTDYYLKGFERQSSLADADGNLYTVAASTYELLEDLSSDARFHALTEKKTCFYEGLVSDDTLCASQSTSAGKYTKQSYAYDDFGNVTSITDDGEPSDGTDGIYAVITYQEPTDYGWTGKYIVSKPRTINVWGEDGSLYRSRDALDYDEFGNLELLRSYITKDKSKYADTRMEHDKYGNLTLVEGPENHDQQKYTLNFTYDDKVHAYIENISDSFGHASEAIYDYKYGRIVTSVDINGNLIRYELDEKGRTREVYGPYDDKDAGFSATIKFSYGIVNSIAATCATTNNKALPGDSDTLDTVLCVDGLGRVVQTRKEAEVNGAPGMVASGKVVYDSLGRVVAQGQPVFRGYANGYLDVPLKNETTFTYDVLDRTTNVTLPDDTTTSTSYGFEGGLFLTHVIDAELNEKKTFKDIKDRIKTVKERLTTPENAITWVVTQYAYNPLSEITAVVDDRQNTTSIDYDKLGRRLYIDNPDTGLVTYDYDPAGNLIQKQTPNLRAKNSDLYIEYDYEFNRLEGIDYPDMPDVAYTYGTTDEHGAFNGLGRIIKVENGDMWEERFYGKLGETVKTMKAVRSDVPSREWPVYTTEYSFDSFGRMQTMVFPDGELLAYGYDQGGLLNYAMGEKGERGGKGKNDYFYLRDLLYDEFGQRVRLEYGNGVVSTYEYYPENRRLRSLITTGAAGQPLQNIEYKYDNVGNVRFLTNKGFVTRDPDVLKEVGFEYRYDDLYRLTWARGEYRRNADTIDMFQNDFDYDTIGNMLTKEQDNWFYHPEDGGTSPRPHTTYTYDYEYSGPKPHAATHIGGRSYHYDRNGNMEKWEEDKTGRTMLLGWDEENRLMSTEEQGKLTLYRYDDAGMRVLKRGKYGEVVYVNENYSLRNGEVASKHIFAGNTRIVTKLVMKENKTGGGKLRAPRPGHDVDGHSGRVPEKSRGNHYGWTKGSNEHANQGNHYGQIKNAGKGHKGKAQEHAPQGNANGKGQANGQGKGNQVNAKGQQNQSTGSPDTNLPGKSEKGLENALAHGKGHKYGIYKRLDRMGYEVTVDGDIVPAGGGDGDGSGDSDSGTGENMPYEVGIYYYHGDHLGSSNVITDRKGRNYEHIEYFPYGETWVDEKRNQTNLPYRFTGKELDPETGMYYFGARYYEPRISRWISTDPILDQYLDGDPVGGIYTPPNLNLYGYSFNNPVTYRDEEGHFVNVLVGAAAGFVGDIAFQVAEQVITGKEIDIDFGSAAVSAAVGATGVGLANVAKKGYKAYKVAKAVKAAKALKAAKAAEKAEKAKGGAYVLKDLKTRVVKKTGRSKDLMRRKKELARRKDTKDLKFEADRRTDVYEQQRGREQIIHDKYKPELDKIKPISDKNPNRQKYLDAAKELE
jgi:RHS repeat-associated protein